MRVNSDYRDMLSAFHEARVEFLVIGAYAMGAHGNPRATGDIDFWVRPTRENAERVWAALEQFGAPRHGISAEDFCTLDVVFQVGLPPRRIDILTSITGVDFDTAWSEKISSTFDGISVSVLSKQHLIANKRATGRPKDLSDVAWLEQTDHWDSGKKDSGT